MIHLKNINKTYFNGTPLHVLKGINLDIKKGEFVSIMGASGSGKSTLLNILGILDNYDSGDYYLNGTLIKNLSETRSAEYRNEMIGFIFQSFNLIPFKNAIENVALPLSFRGMPKKIRLAKAAKMLEMVGLKKQYKHKPTQMSGGQQQRVAIARALATKPAIVLADEPTGNLDSKTSQDVLGLLKITGQKFNQTIVMITHNEEIAQMADRIVHIEDGRIVGGEKDVEGKK